MQVARMAPYFDLYRIMTLQRFFMRYALPILLLVCTGFSASAQINTQIKSQKPDTVYYQPYNNKVTGRFYFSRKFTTLIVRNGPQNYELRYRPNTTLNMGVGATYKWATLNLAYGFGFLNPEHGRGKTRYLDLQFHSYGRKFTVDLMGSFYTGFYLAPKGKGMPNEAEYYLRPDLKINAGGVTVQYIFNHGKFSYRAAFLQNEWQKLSAGTLLAGLEVYTGSIQADSTMVPTAVNGEVAATGFKEVRFLELGPSLGYAYTYVYKQHFFLTGAGSVSLSAGFNTTYDNSGKTHATGIMPNTLFRVSGGYNSSLWAVSILYVSNVQRLARDSHDRAMRLNTGNVRLNLVYRFKPNKRARKMLKVIDDVGGRG
jgi:hypothetical protein